MITKDFNTPHVLCLTLRLGDDFSDVFERKIPNGVKVESNLPPQVDLASARRIETWSGILGWMLMVILLLNLLLNTCFSGLDYVSAIHALEAIQLLVYTTLLCTAYPANANLFLNGLRYEA